MCKFIVGSRGAEAHIIQEIFPPNPFLILENISKS